MKKYLIVLLVVLVLSLGFVGITFVLAEETDEEVLNPAIAPAGFNPQPVSDTIFGSSILIVQDDLTWGVDISLVAGACEQLSIPYDLITSTTFTDKSPSELKTFKVIILASDQSSDYYSSMSTPENKQKLADYVSGGGVLSAGIYAGWIHYEAVPAFLPGGADQIYSPTNDVDFNPDHYLIANPNRLVSLDGPGGYQTIIDKIDYSSSHYFINLPVNTLTVARDADNRPVIIEYPFGSGKVLASGIPMEWFYRYELGLGGMGISLPWDGANNIKLLYNEIDYQLKLSSRIRPDEAVELARDVIDAPYLGDGETWGGKGYSCMLGKFVDSIADSQDTTEEDIKEKGYYYYDHRIRGCSNERGKGLDCSGLILWSYNRAYYKDEIVNWGKCIINKDCPIAHEGADAQYRYNSFPITMSERKPGDLLFFDVIEDVYGKIDHVAMYIGGNEVVHAEGEDFNKIVREDLDDVLVKYGTDFKGFHRVRDYKEFKEENPLAMMQIILSSPADLIITDPDGITLTQGLREVPGMYYYVFDIDEDGELEDIIDIPERKIGDYLIKVVPEPDALPADIYSLEVIIADTTTVLAKDVPISEIPDEPYVVESVGEFITASVKIEPETLNRTSNGVFTAFIQLPEEYDVADIDVDTVKCEDAEVIRGNIRGNDILIVKFRREDLIDVSIGGDVEITVMGELTDGTKFKGVDVIRVIEKAKKK